MKLTLQLKLLPTDVQGNALLDTMRRFNEAASYAAKVGFEAGVFSKPSIQKLCYQELRSRFGLSAQMAIRAIGKCVEAFARDKTVCPVFRPYGAMTYDERILSFKDCHRVSILTVDLGRQLIAYVFGEYQAANLNRIRGQADLVYRDGMFFLYCTIQFEEPPPVQVNNFLGVDLGIVNIATDSTGEAFSGEQVTRNRRRRTTARKQYQRKGTKSAKRRLKKMAGRQRRYQAHCNHVISKKLVAKAKTLGLGIALEDLSFIRDRVQDTVSKRFRRQLGNWGFSQLGLFVAYKAEREGIRLVLVNPRYTSQTRHVCGHREKANRRSQAEFVCKQCGLSVNADENAALNIQRLGRSVNRPQKQPPSSHGEQQSPRL